MAKARKRARKTTKRARAGRVVRSKSGRTYRKGQSGKWVSVGGHKRGGPNKKRKAKRKGARRRTRR